MVKPLVIFGTGAIAELAHYYFSTDSAHEVVGFTVDSEYVTEQSFCGLPVVAFEEVTNHFPVDTHCLFVALSYSNLNDLRTEKVAACEALGYTITNYVSSRASILTSEQFGVNSFILEDNTVQPFVRIGRNVTLWSGNHIGHHSTIEDNVFISSHVVVSGGVTIGANCFIGVNATIRDHITIGSRTVVGAGALLLADTEPGGVYVVKGTERSPVPSSKLRRI